MRLDNFKKNLRLASNRGVAMISVMITLTVCLLVATIVLQITYTSLLSRKVNTQASNNFYSAESAIDDVQTVLQSIAVYSTKQMNSGDEFVDTVVDSLLTASGATAISDTNTISQYLYSNLDDDLKKVFGTKTVDASGNTIYTYDPSKFKVSAVTVHDAGVNSDKGKLTFSVELAYEDENGYYTEISTDLIINDVVTRKSASSYALGSYSMFTGGGIKIHCDSDFSDGQYAALVQEGNCYVGTMGAEAPTAMKVYNTVAYITGAAIINGDVYITDYGVLNFTAGSDGTSRTEITIRGTVYIDATSALVISEDVDFLCEDIVIIDGATEYSYFENSTPAVYTSGTNNYKSLFPYQHSNIDDMADTGNTAIKGLLADDFRYNKTGGCVLISSDDNAYVAKKATDGWNILDGGTARTCDALINRSAVCVPQAKATLWTYDGQQATVDPEMMSFVNCQLLYFQNKTTANTWIHAQYPQVIGHSSTSTVSKTSLDVDFGGAEVKGVSDFDFGSTTSDLISGGYLQNSGGGSSKLTFQQMGISDIKLGENTLSEIYFKVRNASECAENIADSANAVLIAAIWDSYTIQMNGGSVVGILISADCCEYKVQNNNLVTAYSVLNAKDEGDNTAKTQMDNLFSELQYVSFARDVSNSTQWTAAGVNCHDYYQLTLLDSLFVGGMKSFTSDGSGEQETDAYIDTNSMYDFITVENWQAN